MIQLNTRNEMNKLEVEEEKLCPIPKDFHCCLEIPVRIWHSPSWCLSRIVSQRYFSPRRCSCPGKGRGLGV